MSSKTAALSVDKDSGWLTVTNQTQLDRESQPVISLQLCAQSLLPIETKSSLQNKNKKRHTNHKESPGERIMAIQEFPVVIPDRDRNKPTVIDKYPVIVKSKPVKPSPGVIRVTPVSSYTEPQTKVVTRTFFAFSSPTTENPSVTTHGTLFRTPNLVTTKDKPFRYRGRGSGPRDLPFGARIARIPSSRKLRQLNHEKFRDEKVSDTNGTAKNETLQRSKRDAFRIVRNKNTEANNLKPITEKTIDIVTLKNNKSCTFVRLTLLDANDNNPTFTPSNQYYFSVPQDSMPGTRIGKVSFFRN